jgi:hypothetical protein
MSTFLFFSQCEQLGWQFPLLHHACIFYSLVCSIRAITWWLLPKSAVMYKSTFGDVSIQWQTCLVRQEEQIHLTSTLIIITSIVFSCNCAPLNVLYVKIAILLGVWNLMSTIAGFFIDIIIKILYHGNILFMPKSDDICTLDEGSCVMFMVSFVFLPHKNDQWLLDFLVILFSHYHDDDYWN